MAKHTVDCYSGNTAKCSLTPAQAIRLFYALIIIYPAKLCKRTPVGFVAPDMITGAEFRFSAIFYVFTVLIVSPRHKQYAIADCNICHTFSDCIYDSARFRTTYVKIFRLIAVASVSVNDIFRSTLSSPYAVVIHTCRINRYKHLACTGKRRINNLILESSINASETFCPDSPSVHFSWNNADLRQCS